MTTRTAFAFSFDVPAHALLQGFRKLSETWRRRRDLATLRELDDHMLRDIGLSRSDLRDAVRGGRRNLL